MALIHKFAPMCVIRVDRIGVLFLDIFNFSLPKFIEFALQIIYVIICNPVRAERDYQLITYRPTLNPRIVKPNDM